MLRSFYQCSKGNLIEGIIGIILLGTLSYGFWTVWNNNLHEAGDKLKNRIESDCWLD